jgi:hypothetical protein
MKRERGSGAGSDGSPDRVPTTTADMQELAELEQDDQDQELSAGRSFAVRARSTFPTTRLLKQRDDDEPSPGPPMSRDRVHVYLVRHGESEANVDPSILLTLSDHVVGLSAQGREQATAVGTFLREALAEGGCRLLVSPYKRARDTADLVVRECQHTDTFRDVCENVFLGEQQFGLFEGVCVVLPCVCPHTRMLQGFRWSKSKRLFRESTRILKSQLRTAVVSTHACRWASRASTWCRACIA